MENLLKTIEQFLEFSDEKLEELSRKNQALKKSHYDKDTLSFLHTQENSQVVSKFLEKHPNFEQVNLKHERKDILKDGCILITPELYGSDGFFISQFRRIS